VNIPKIPLPLAVTPKRPIRVIIGTIVGAPNACHDPLAAAAEDDHGLGDLTPCWIYPGDARLQRRIVALPLSRDEERWARLQESLALYRLAFGQPRQEDMLAALERRGIAGQPERIADIRIDLRPPAPHEP